MAGCSAGSPPISVNNPVARCSAGYFNSLRNFCFKRKRISTEYKKCSKSNFGKSLKIITCTYISDLISVEHIISDLCSNVYIFILNKFTHYLVPYTSSPLPLCGVARPPWVWAIGLITCYVIVHVTLCVLSNKSSRLSWKLS